MGLAKPGMFAVASRRRQGATAMIAAHPDFHFQLPAAMTHTHSAIDVHTHVVPENFPAYTGTTPDIPWPSMAPAHP